MYLLSFWSARFRVASFYLRERFSGKNKNKMKKYFTPRHENSKRLPVTKTQNKMNIEKQNALVIESAIRIAKEEAAGGIGIRGLLILCTVARLGRPPVRAIAKSIGSTISTVSAQTSHLTKAGWLVVEEDEIYMVNHYRLTPKGEAIFAATKVQIAQKQLAEATAEA